MGHIIKSDIDLTFLQTILKEGGQLALGQRGQMVASVKEDHSPVTEVDRQVEDFLVERILTRYPGHSILTEETGARSSGGEFAWVIDPIDGTRAFASGLPVWGVSIGVMRANEPYAGGLYLPVTGEMYWGTTGQAFYNDRPLPKIRSVDPDSPLVFLAVPSEFHLHFEITFPRVRSMGSTAAHLAYVATGAAVGVLSKSFSLWDIAGLLPVLTATGIQTATLSGKTFRPADLMDGRKAREPFIAAHPGIMDTLRSAIRLIQNS